MRDLMASACPERVPVRPSTRPLVLAAALLLIAASRLLRLCGLELDHDEVWTIWQTFGSPRQILAWTPYDWPPLHFLALGAWQELAGIHPIARCSWLPGFLAGLLPLAEIPVKAW